MDFPVTAEFAATANAGLLHDDARGDSPEWPASFVETVDGWVYRVDERDGVIIASDIVQAAIDQHVPSPPVEVVNRETIERRAAAALEANATFLALAAPTNAQTLTQVKTLTKECSALVRLTLNLLDSTVGT